MLSVDSKLDRIIEELATLKAISSQHTRDLTDLQDQLEPVFLHVTSVQAIIKAVTKVGAGVIGVVSCAAAILLLRK